MSFVYYNVRSTLSATNIIIKGTRHHIFKKSCSCRCFSTTTSNRRIKNEDSSGVYIFDRYTKNLQRERAAVASDVNLYDYLKDEIGYRLADRIFDIKRKFKLAADIGKGQKFCLEVVLFDFYGRLQQGLRFKTYRTGMC